MHPKQFTSAVGYLPLGKTEMEIGSPSQLREERREEGAGGEAPFKAVMLSWGSPREPLVLLITAALPLLFFHCGDTSVVTFFFLKHSQ